jgi:farnesyl-diphosphate farnesyltransferase
MDLHTDALRVLKETSRTFYIPISRLPGGLLDAVASAYLMMRAIDEIEDHAALDNQTKSRLLRRISLNCQAADDRSGASCFSDGLPEEAAGLPEVSLRIGEWALLAPKDVAARIHEATAAMADRMAHWTDRNWLIRTEAELNQYTFSVAGSVGLLLSDLWAWHDGTQTNRFEAVGFGRGLQAVNIARNIKEDRRRGVSFLPDGWEGKHIRSYARRNLELADSYTASIPKGPARDFCKIPLALAHATLNVLDLGREKLSRDAVHAVIKELGE